MPMFSRGTTSRPRHHPLDSAAPTIILKNKIINWFIIYLVLHSSLEINKAELCPLCEKYFKSLGSYKWRCKGKLHTTPSTTQGNHDNIILRGTIETTWDSLANLNKITSNQIILKVT